MEIDQPFKRNFDVGKVGTECLRELVHEIRLYIRIIHKNKMDCEANLWNIFNYANEIIYEVFLNLSKKSIFLCTWNELSSLVYHPVHVSNQISHLNYQILFRLCHIMSYVLMIMMMSTTDNVIWTQYLSLDQYIGRYKKLLKFLAYSYEFYFIYESIHS